MNREKKDFWRLITMATVVVLVLLAVSVLSGCRAYYENAGVHVRTGSITAPIEVSEPTSSINIRALYSMDGIDFYAAKGCIVTMAYTNIYTNSYFGIVATKGRQVSEVTIQPTFASDAETNAETNAAPVAAVEN